MLDLRAPHLLPGLYPAAHPAVDPVPSDVVLEVQRDLQRRVLLLTCAGTPKRAGRDRPSPRVVQRNRSPLRDYAGQPPQPLFVIGNGAWEHHLVRLYGASWIIAESAPGESAGPWLAAARGELDHFRLARHLATSARSSLLMNSSARQSATDQCAWNHTMHSRVAVSAHRIQIATSFTGTSRRRARRCASAVCPRPPRGARSGCRGRSARRRAGRG